MFKALFIRRSCQFYSRLYVSPEKAASFVKKDTLPQQYKLLGLFKALCITRKSCQFFFHGSLHHQNKLPDFSRLCITRISCQLFFQSSLHYQKKLPVLFKALCVTKKSCHFFSRLFTSPKKLPILFKALTSTENFPVLLKASCVIRKCKFGSNLLTS